MFDHLLKSSHRDDSNTLSNIGFGEEIMHVMSIEGYFKNLIWFSVITVQGQYYQGLLCSNKVSVYG